MADQLPREVGTVVVGGGTAGNVIAARLALAGTDILVLEAGPDFGPFGSVAWPPDMLDARRLGYSNDWGYDSSDTLPTKVLFERARAIGGCSCFNGTAQTWGHRRDYDDWAAAGNPGWTADELRPLFAEATRMMRVRRYRVDELTPWQRAWYEAGGSLGHPQLETSNDLDQTIGFAPEENNIVDGVRWNTAFAYLDPVRSFRHVRVTGNAHVDRVVVKAGRVAGVIVLWQGERHGVHTERVVLCGGTYNSPQILQRSGIGEPALIKELGLDVVANLPGVGENLHDQPFLLMSWVGTGAIRSAMGRARETQWAPDEQTIAKAASSATEDVFDMHFLPYSPSHLGEAKRWSCGVAALLPRSRGYVRARSLDPETKPLIDHRLLTDPDGNDALVLAEGVDQLRAIAASGRMRKVLGPELYPGRTGSDHAELVRRIRASPENYCNPVGTCKMGPQSDPAAVVDHDGQVHGITGCYVADCSIMPTAPRATTAMPAVVVGERIASYLLTKR